MSGQDKRDIHEAIEEWHENGPDGVELHDFLGLTWEQYRHWVEGGPLPQGGAWYDGVRRAQRNAPETRRKRALLKTARRRALEELGKLYRRQYLSLLAKHLKELEGADELLVGVAGGAAASDGVEGSAAVAVEVAGGPGGAQGEGGAEDAASAASGEDATAGDAGVGGVVSGGFPEAAGGGPSPR